MTPSCNMKLDKDSSEQLMVTTPDGMVHCPVTVVRAFPMSSHTDENISIINASGKEIIWLETLNSLTPAEQGLIREALVHSNRFHKIARVHSISSSNVPCTWRVETLHGDLEFTLENEEDITCLNNDLFLIKDNKEFFYMLPHGSSLDRKSLKLVESFIF